MDWHDRVGDRVKGQAGVASLALLAALAAVTQGKAPGTNLFGVVMVLLVGAFPWLLTLTGFLRDLRPPALAGRVLLAHRPRRAAIIVSWTALFGVILGVPLFVLSFLAEGPPALSWGTFLVAAAGALVATILPAASRAWTIRAGYVALSTQGLVIQPPAPGELELHWFPVPEDARWHPAWFRGVAALTTAEDRLRLTHRGPVRSHPSVASSLPDPVARALDPRVQWVPGAREAVTRWSRHGFAPTAEEAVQLALPAEWSPDPASIASSPARRWARARRETLPLAGIVVLAAVVFSAALLAL